MGGRKRAKAEDWKPEEQKEKPSKRGRKAQEEQQKVPKRGRKATQTTHAQISEFLNSNAGNPDCLKELKKLIKSSKCGRRLLSGLIDQIFSLVQDTPAHFVWGKSAIQLITSEFMKPHKQIRDAFFFPSKDSQQQLVEYLGLANKTMIICVFTITNNTLADAIRAARDRGVDVRIISDDECMKMRGSDVEVLHNEGFPVRVDLNQRAHMHNKFVVIDDYLLITGSFNWTKQAVGMNQENLVVLDDPVLCKIYTEEFNKLWEQFAESVQKHFSKPAAVEQKAEQQKKKEEGAGEQAAHD